MRQFISSVQTHLKVTSHEAMFVAVFATVIVTGSVGSRFLPLDTGADLHEHTSVETVIRMLDSLGSEQPAMTALGGDSTRQADLQSTTVRDVTSRSEAAVPRLQRAVSINKASAKELEHLPGIGPAMALRIIERRRSRPFTSAEDLLDVKGIGPKTLEKLRPYVIVP